MWLKKNNIYGLLAGLLAALGWGSIGLWVKEIPLPAFEIATYRFLGAGFFLTCLTWFFYKKKFHDFSRKTLIGSAICGWILALQFISTIVAYQRLLIGEATVLTNLHIFVIILAYFALLIGNKRLLLSFGLSAGLLLLALHLLFIQGQDVILDSFGILMGFCSSILFGLYTILVERFFQNSPERYLGLIFIFGAIPMLAYLTFTNQIHITSLPQSGWISLIILLGFSTILAHFAYLLAVKWSGAMGAGILSYFAIAIAFFIDYFSGKSISLQQWLGAVLLVLILSSLNYVNQQLGKWEKAPTIQS